MKDLFLGMTIGIVAGAMIASSPKAKKVASDVKNKVTDVCGCGSSGSEGEQRQSGGCDCGCGE